MGYETSHNSVMPSGRQNRRSLNDVEHSLRIGGASLLIHLMRYAEFCFTCSLLSAFRQGDWQQLQELPAAVNLNVLRLRTQGRRART